MEDQKSDKIPPVYTHFLFRYLFEVSLHNPDLVLRLG